MLSYKPHYFVFVSSETCPSSAIGSWVSRPSDTGTGHDCYFFGSYSNSSTLMTQQEAADFCATMSVQSLDRYGVPTDVVPTLYIVNSQAERVSSAIHTVLVLIKLNE